MNGRHKYAGLRSILEVPILNERYWSKVPEVSSDAIMVDLEDSATPGQKDEARQAVVDWLPRTDYFGDRTVIVRVNNLLTPWARDDLAALSDLDATFLVCYPKVEHREELDEVASMLAGAGRELFVMIETARAVVGVDAIASHPDVVGLHFGYVDLAADVGSRPFAGQGLYEPAQAYPRSRIATSAAAHGHFVTGGSLIPDHKDALRVREHVEMWRDTGYTACVAITPRHVNIINQVFSPSAKQIADATLICTSYAAALERGEPAVVVEGRTITMPDYRVAALVLARAGVVPVSST